MLSSGRVRGPWRDVLTVRNYRIFLVAQLVSTTGIAMQRVTQDWLVLQLGGGPAAVGVAVALQFFPLMLLGPFAGVLVDRFPRRSLLLLSQGLTCLLAAGLGVLVATGSVRLWAVYACAACLGVVSAIDAPARQVIVSDLVEGARVRPAITLNATAFQLSALVGPAVAGVLIHTVGEAGSFLLNAAAAAAVLVLLWMLRPGEMHGGAVDGAARGLAAVRAGFAHVLSRPVLRWMVLLAGLLGAFGMNGPVVLAAFARDEWHTGAGGYALFTSLSALGSMLGAVLAGRGVLARARGVVPCAAVFGLTQALAALSPHVLVFDVLLVVVGAATLTFLVSASAIVQLSADEAMRGRVMALFTPVLLGGHAAGALLQGWLVEVLGVRAALVTAGALAICSAAVVAALFARSGGLRVVLVGRGRGLRAGVAVVQRAGASAASFPAGPVERSSASARGDDPVP
ncbi:MFS transporter [Kineococcus sp. NUM-3379]